MQSRKTVISSQDDTWQVVEVDEFLDISKLGKSKGYKLISSGKVKSVLVDGKRLVFIKSWYDYLQRLLEEQATFTRRRHPMRWPRQSDADQPAAAATPPPPRRRDRPPNHTQPL